MEYIVLILFGILVFYFMKDMFEQKEYRKDKWTDIHQTEINNVFPYWFWLLWAIALVGLFLYGLATNFNR